MLYTFIQILKYKSETTILNPVTGHFTAVRTEEGVDGDMQLLSMARQPAILS